MTDPADRRVRRNARFASAVAIVLSLASGGACTTDGAEPDQPVTLIWQHSDMAEPLRGFWSQVAAEFEEQHPLVTVRVVSDIQSPEGQDPPGGEDSPDLFLASGAELVEGVLAGSILDITDQVGAELELIGGSAAGWNVDGRQYGLPYSAGAEGFWYRKSLFATAGIAVPPATMAELGDAVARLRAAGIVPIIAHIESYWPAAHYWQHLALRACGTGVLRRSAVDLRFADPCFVAAGAELAAFVATDPFQPGWDSLNQAGESATALLVRGRAAMALAGDWYRQELGALARELGEDPGPVLADLGWMPFPSLPAGSGDPGAVLGGGKGFACSAQAPPECVELLRYVVSRPVQTRYAGLGQGLPAVGDAAAGAPGPYPRELLDALYGADHVQLWLEVAYGGPVVDAMTQSVVDLFHGFASAQDVVAAMDAAGRQVR